MGAFFLPFFFFLFFFFLEYRVPLTFQILQQNKYVQLKPLSRLDSGLGFREVTCKKTELASGDQLSPFLPGSVPYLKVATHP